MTIPPGAQQKKDVCPQHRDNVTHVERILVCTYRISSSLFSADAFICRGVSQLACFRVCALFGWCVFLPVHCLIMCHMVSIFVVVFSCTKTTFQGTDLTTLLRNTNKTEASTEVLSPCLGRTSEKASHRKIHSEIWPSSWSYNETENYHNIHNKI